MPEHTVKTLNKLIYYGIIIIFLFAATASQGFDIGGLVVGAGFMGNRNRVLQHSQSYPT